MPIEHNELHIIKQKDTYRTSVEISENSKQQPSITIKVSTDESTADAVTEALEQYKAAKAGLGMTVQ